jgi:hypothetical protein
VLNKPTDHIFISYSRRDDDLMRKITFHLRDQGYKVWVDNEKLIPGTPAWEEAIETAIKNAFAVVVLLSPDSKGSEWVRREITYADQFEVRVFPVLIKGTEDESLPLRLVTRQYVDMRKDEAAGLSALNDAIRFHSEKKHTLEMKRPLGQKEAVNVPHSPSQTAVEATSKSSGRAWLPWVALILVCCLIVAAWAGVRTLAPFFDTAATEPALTEPNLPETPAPEATEVFAGDVPSMFLENVEITLEDTFDNPATGNWTILNGEIANGILEITGNANYDGVFRNKSVRANEGLLLDFTFSEGVIFEIFLDRGVYSADDYKRFGTFIDNSFAYINMRGAEDASGGYSGNLTMESDTTYVLLLAVLPDAELLQVIWNPANPEEAIIYRKTMDTTWLGLDLTLFIQGDAGTVQVDNYRELTFSGGK